MDDSPPLLRVCRLLNAAGAKYLLCGGQACILHGAWTVSYAEALPGAKEAVVEGVRIPYLGLADLIASKETYREQDALDRARLRALQQDR